LKTARAAIQKLGYENSVFSADSKPLVTPPEKVGTNYIPRYVFAVGFKMAGCKDSSIIPALLDIEINASNRKIEMMLITSRDTRRPSPKVEVTRIAASKSTRAKISAGRQQQRSWCIRRAFLRGCFWMQQWRSNLDLGDGRRVSGS